MGIAKKMARKKKREVRSEKIRRAIYNQAFLMETIFSTTIILFAAAKEVYGFGEQRLKRLADKVKIHTDCLKDKYVTLEEMKKILYEEAKIDIRAEEHEDEEGQIADYVVDEMSVKFLLSLMDLFGFKNKRLYRFYKRASDMSHDINNHKLKLEDLAKNLREVNLRLERSREYVI